MHASLSWIYRVKNKTTTSSTTNNQRGLRLKSPSPKKKKRTTECVRVGGGEGCGNSQKMENKKEIITSTCPSLILYLSHSSFSNPNFPFLSKLIITSTKHHQIFLPLLFLSLSLFPSSLLFAFFTLRLRSPLVSDFVLLFFLVLFVCEDRSMHGSIVCFTAYFFVGFVLIDLCILNVFSVSG